MKNNCPVCGYNNLDFKPYDEQGNASFEICPCCGFEFGCDDFPDKPKSFIEWRKKWIDNGCNWFSRNPAPQDWNAKEQIRNFYNENIIDFSPFESIDDFKFSLTKGREIEFHWNGTDYGAFHEGEGKESFFICESNKAEQGRYFETIDELLDYTIQGQPLRDFITQAEVWHRNL